MNAFKNALQKEDGVDTMLSPSTSPASPAAVAFPAGTEASRRDRIVFASRVARTAAGIVLAVGALNLPVVAVMNTWAPSASDVLRGTWVAALGVFALAFLVALVVTKLTALGRLGDRWLKASLAWPLVGLSLLLPLTIHGLVMAGSSARDFDSWVAMSCAIVGHCHIGLALMATMRVLRLVDGERAMTAPAIYGVTIGLAMVPGAIFLLIPPFLVAATGLPFLFLLWLPELIIKKERAYLARDAATL